MTLAFVPPQLDLTNLPSIVPVVLLIVAGVVIVSGFALAVASRLKRCPPNRILVKYGKTGKGRSAMPIHGGAA